MKKIKNLAIFFIISIYAIGLVLTFSGDLLNQIQVVRHKNQIEKIANAEILEFSLKDWNNFSESNEINFQNNYYDIVSFEKINSRIIAKVVKDDFENEICVSLAKIFNKSKLPYSKSKKSNSFSKHIPSNKEYIAEYILIISSKKQKNLNEVLTSKTSNFINFQEKPPC